MAIPFLPYRNPEVTDSIEGIIPFLKKRHVTKVLCVTDPVLQENGITKPLEALLKENKIRCVVYDKTQANPSVCNVEEARKLYLQEGCEAILAIGGGSSIDCAKAVGARIAYPRRALYQMKGTLKILKKIPTLIAVPTTAGTGSEITLTSVITDREKKHKYTLNSFPLIPRFAVLDPKVTATLPPSLTASTGMDALTHAVEAYIGRSTTKETRTLALQAVKLIFQNIETAYRDGTNLHARAQMLQAAHMAGAAFSKSYVGYVHAVAHSLGGQYNTPHGLANAVLLPVVLEIYGASVHKKLHELGIAAGVCTTGESDSEGADRFIRAIRELNRNMSIPDKLQISEEDIPQMTKHAAHEANPLYPVPELMDEGELKKIYYRIMA